TALPTTAPTVEPTSAPSVAPTTAPSADPTVEPTAQPTVEPTAERTVQPTTDPAPTETAAPTESPVPTTEPVPTSEPTQNPVPPVEPTVAPVPPVDPVPSDNPVPTNNPVPPSEPAPQPTQETTVAPVPQESHLVAPVVPAHTTHLAPPQQNPENAGASTPAGVQLPAQQNSAPAKNAPPAASSSAQNRPTQNFGQYVPRETVTAANSPSTLQQWVHSKSASTQENPTNGATLTPQNSSQQLGAQTTSGASLERFTKAMEPADWVDGFLKRSHNGNDVQQAAVNAGVTGNSQERQSSASITSEALTRGQAIIEGYGPAIVFSLVGLGGILYVIRQFSHSSQSGDA
ncbi:MAG: hypothetical protein Q3974_09085, partial [Rothia sp. (in: high G+C Gram-positive bacteria)]|nr:hypothetical protein [Rothia sp. (in: high G+C Gram-positive bacteria)]